jgi:uncharacterized protein YcgL (UPF0745 family)
MKCHIYRCQKKDEMYLYVPYQEDRDAALRDLPEGLLKLTGRLDWVMELDLASRKKLARVKVEEVMTSLREKGYFLQMPPNDLLRSDQTMLENPSEGF